MSDKQIQPVTSRDYALARRARPRGLVGQVSMVLLEPGTFFRGLPVAENSRQWVWAALLILALVGFSAVRQDALLDGGSAGSLPADLPSAPGGDTGGAFFAPAPVVSGGGGGGGGSAFLPGLDQITTPPAAGGASGANTNDTWTTALLAASSIVLSWGVMAVLLCEVSLFNGTAPRLGQNFQVAVWTTVPIGLMAALQLLYFAAGGTVGEPGVSGLLAEWPAYDTLSPFMQSLALSLASRLTLFWLWSLALVYIGGRLALRGKTWAVMLVVIAWIVVAVVAPVLTGTVAAPESETANDLPPGMPELFGGGPGGDTGGEAPVGGPAGDLFGDLPGGDSGAVESFALPEITPEAEATEPPNAGPEAEATETAQPGRLPLPVLDFLLPDASPTPESAP